MLNASLGTIGVWLAFVASLIGAVVIVVGLVRQRGAAAGASAASAGGSAAAGGLAAPAPVGVLDGRLFAPVMLAGAVLATIAMEHALITHDFSLVFVAENNSSVTPLLYSITGLWSALAGSILLWGLVLFQLAIDCDLMATREQEQSKVLGEGFKSAVV